MKQVYPLNLPPIESLLLDSFKQYQDDDTNYNYIVEDDLHKVVKKEWHNFLGLDWLKLIYFKKEGVHGNIHTDAANIEDTIPPDNNLTVWGINWVAEGSRVMLYWNWNNVSLHGVTPGSINVPEDGVVTRFVANAPPDEVYIMQPGKAYLVNATLPHCASGLGKGKVYSYRPTTNDLEWSKVVELFKEYIVYP